MTVQTDEQDGVTTVIVTPEPPPADQAEPSSLISEIVEARVDAERADETATEALEAAEQAQEGTQWNSERLNTLEQSMWETMETLRSEISELRSNISASIPPLVSEQSAEELLNLTQAAMAENPSETVEALEAIAETPAETISSETLTEASSETPMEALERNEEENPEAAEVVAAVLLVPQRRVRYI